MDAYQTSQRLTDVLRKSGVRVLGDLHGRKVGDFAWEKNCGFKTLHELDSLARWAAGDGESSAEPRNGEVSGKNGKTHKKVRTQRACFAIPESLSRLRFDELPITQRLANVCRSIGVRTLGDLNGRNTYELLQYNDCGWRTLAEIEQLIEQAVSGEFDATRIKEGTAAAAELMTLVERGMGKLPPREGEFLFARIEGVTFAEIGRRYGFTRARVHQVVAKAVETLKKSYGPRIPRLLEMVKRCCMSIPNGSPLTPALLEPWISLPRCSGAKAGDSFSDSGLPPSRRYGEPVEIAAPWRLSTEAQLRLIAALDKTIPCYVERAPKASRPNGLDLDLASLARLLRLGAAPEVPRRSGPWPSEHLRSVARPA